MRKFLRPSGRPVVSIVGRVQVARIAYQGRGIEGLHPMDAALNLPSELYSVPIGKRRVEELASRAAQDFYDFYAAREP